MSKKKPSAGGLENPGAKGRPPKSSRDPAATIEPAAQRIDVPPKEDLIAGQISPQATITRGPRKKRATEAPPPRLSNHKARSVWFQARTAWPVREAPVHSLVEERERVRK